MTLEDGFAKTFEAKRDENANSDDGDMDAEVFQRVDGPLRCVDVHAESVKAKCQREVRCGPARPQTT
jgi:hypothetical protein